MKKSLYPFAIATLAALSVSAAQAEMYRWTDDQGRVVYSQTPPPDGRASSTVAAPPAPSAEQVQAAKAKYAKPKESMSDEELAAEQEKEASKAKKVDSEKMEEQCAIARKNLQTMESRPRNSLYSTGGDYKRYTNEEWEAEHQRLQDTLNKYCGE